ncbi:MAG: PqqD family peptide modification chaperone [Thermodesulfobacteriota bacterium]|nr:PqqD family peptide modification chaperone [Thermodesulfobacteriota bacterium]
MSFFTYSPYKTGREDGDAHILFHATESEWVKVNDTGMEIAQYLDDGVSLDDVTRRLCAEYGISAEAAKYDVLSVSEQLSAHHFLDGNARARPARFPTLNLIFFHLTSRCNLSCPHCYTSRSQDDVNKDLPGSLVFRMIDELANRGGNSITLSGGEPLLHPEIRNILKYAGSKVEIRLLTNGTLINRAWADFLADMNVFIQISIDGSTKKIHDSIRGRGSFEKSLKSLEYLQEAGLRERINFSTTVMNQNFHDLPGIISLAGRLDVSLARFIPLRRKGTAKRKWESVGSGLTIRDSERFYEHTSLLQKNGGAGVDISCGLSGFLLKMPEEFEDDIWCPIGRQLVIDVNGDAYPCVLMMEDEFLLGNAFHNSLDNMIKSDAMIAVCRALAERRNKIKKCSVCNWRNLCQAGCMGQALDNKGTIWDTDDFCDYRSRAYKEAFGRVLTIEN